MRDACICEVSYKRSIMTWVHCKKVVGQRLPRTEFRLSKLPKPHGRTTPTQSFRTSYWHSYPEHTLHTARPQSRMAGRRQSKIFASPIGTAAPNTVFTQQGAKPRMAGRHHAKFLHLLLAQLPQTQFSHSKTPNPNARKTSTQNFRISYWHSYPEHTLHTARPQTRMPGRYLPHKSQPQPRRTQQVCVIWKRWVVVRAELCDMSYRRDVMCEMSCVRWVMDVMWCDVWDELCEISYGCDEMCEMSCVR